MLSALNYYIFEPLKMSSYSHFRFRFFQKLHELSNGRISMAYRKIVSMFSLANLFKPQLASDRLTETELQKTNTQLENLGWSILPFQISATDLHEIHEFLKTSPCFSNHPQERLSLTDELKKETHFNRYIWSAEDSLKNPTLQRIITDPIWAVIARRYLKGNFILSNLQIWLDPAPKAKMTVNDSHFYHYDIDNPKFLKFFIYLTDMDKDTGAHCYIQKTHFPVKDVSFAKSKRYSDQEVHNHYGLENEKLFAAPAGTIIAEDTLGFHKGSTPKKDFRAILQLQFSYFEIPDPIKVQKTELKNLSQDLRKIYHKYVQ